MSNMVVTPLGVDCDAAIRPEVLSSESGWSAWQRHRGQIIYGVEPGRGDIT
jgi:hypothetical protein